jgi:hypothetical protein
MATEKTTLEPGNRAEWFSNGLQLLATATVGGAAGGYFSSRRLSSRQVTKIYPKLQAMHERMKNPIIRFTVDPYAQLTPTHALILQGGNMTGKTSCLADSIPLRQRWLFGPSGLYLNGAIAKEKTEFKEWIATEMFGESTQKGANKVMAAAEAHLESQRCRRYLQRAFGDHLPVWAEPRPAIVIVDQLEELMQCFPAESLNWINNLTNAHVRHNILRLILVVNSEDAVKSIQGLNQGPRWKVCTLGKVDKPPANIDADYFVDCDSNIGLYKQLQEQEVNRPDVKEKAHQVLALWRAQFHVPYPLLAATSWRLLSVVELKTRLLSALEKVISAEKLAILTPHLKELKKEQILAATQKEWEIRFKEGWGLMDAKSLAIDVKTVLGNEAPAVDDAPAADATEEKKDDAPEGK